jgi:uncharacterized damage-inducible protein DinB
MMTLDQLREEFEDEARATRKILERVPADRLDWRPHEKSFTTRGLASHIVDCFSWGESILNGDEFDVDPSTYKPFEAASIDDLLTRFDAVTATCLEALERTDESRMMNPWRLKIKGRQRFERPRAVVLRDFALSHMIHHRGQLSVYLRLLNVPVPGVYGPSADDA